jgi:hypothetical protein
VARSPARSEKRQRAAVRRDRRGAAAPHPSAAAASPWPVAPATLLWAGATLLLLGLVASNVAQKITWYLAVDQYGYLAFAHDLIRGHIFHHWAPLDALQSALPAQVDVLSQTYIWDHGKLYCRYAPGFPLMLASWLLVFGDDGAHYLNPTVYLALLAALLVVQMRLFRSRWRATAGVALVVLLPTQLYLWGTTLTRDMAAQLFGVLGILAVLGRPLDRRRLLVGGLALGFTASIRPDGVLYMASAGLVVLLRLVREHALWRPALPRIAAGVLGVVVGLSPFLTYNWIATGNPFRATQGMELQNFLPGSEDATPATPTTTVPGKVGYPPGAWIGGAYDPVQGGGLRLSNLAHVLPGNVAILRGSYGDVFIGLAIFGAILALIQRRLLFAATVPYCVLALFFYSCWTHADGRYMSGIFCLLPLLIVEGIFGPLDLVRRLVRSGRLDDGRRFAVAVAIALVAAALFVSVPQPRSVLPVLVPLVCVGVAAAAAAATVWPRRRIVRYFAPVLALVLVGVSAWRSSEAAQTRAAFQQPQMQRARATFARAVEPNAVVITTEEIGRPGENIDYYSGVAHAFYITDLMRWRMTVLKAASLLTDGGMVPYLLLPPSQPGLAGMVALLRNVFDVDLVAKVPARQAMDYFVAAPFHHGIDLELYRLKRRPKA